MFSPAIVYAIHAEGKVLEDLLREMVERIIKLENELKEMKK